MKKIMVNCFLAILMHFLFVTVHAQKKEMPSAEERAIKLTEWMKTNLQLTDTQVPQVQQINLKYANKMDELKNSSQGKRQKLMTLKNEEEAKDAELKQILSDSQLQTYMAKKEELKKQSKEKMKEKKNRG